MKINEFYEGGDLNFDAELDKDDEYGSETDFKQDAMQIQLMKISDSEPGPDIKNPLRTVTTDDGDTIKIEHGEAVAMLKILQMPMKPEKKMEIMRQIQNTDGLNQMLDFVQKRGLAK
jgi:hypothetical protein